MFLLILLILLAPKQPAEPTILRINQARSNLALQSVHESSKLDESAQAKCNHMVENDYWNHNAPDGTKWSSFIHGYRFMGEILARGYIDPDLRQQAWMDSLPHKETIIKHVYTNAGVAYCTYSDGSQLTVVHFGGNM